MEPSRDKSNRLQGQRTLSPYDTKDLQQEIPITATGFAFHHEAHLPGMLLQQGQSKPSEPCHILRPQTISGLQSILIVRHVKAPVASALNPPMIADAACKHSDIQWEAAEVVSNISLLFVAPSNRVDDKSDCLELCPLTAVREV
jgi:hypothetical protein